MEQQATIQAPTSANGNSNEFVTVSQFHKQLAENTQSQYSAKFSFGPYLKSLQKESNPTCQIAKSLFAGMEEGLGKLPPIEELLANRNQLEGVVPLLFPLLFMEGQMGFLTVPFTKDFVFMTPSFKDLLQNEVWEINMSNLVGHSRARHGALDAGNLVLNRFYGENVDLIFSEILRVRHMVTGLEKHFKINIILDFVEVKALKPLKKLSRQQIHQLLNEWEDQSLWLKYIPPENFAFEGFVVGQVIDVTDREILSLVETMMAKEEGDVDYGDGLIFLQNQVRSFLQMPELDFGSTYVQDSKWQESTTWSLLRHFDAKIMRPSFKDPKGIYGRAISQNKAIAVGDLAQEKHLGPLEKEILKRGYKSLLLAPVYNEDGGVGGIMEIASPQPYRFNQMTVLKLQEFVDLYAMGMTKFVREIDNKVRLTIQQQFTSIHPSVEWKFRNAATEFYWSRTAGQGQAVIRPIVFKDIYPIYGQADIVGSSKLRNKFIAEDLIENLQQVNNLMETVYKEAGFHLLDVYLGKTKAHLERLQKGEFVSKDETEIVGLLTREIHPLLHQLKKQYSDKIPVKYFDKYFTALDPDLNIIYQKRKDYENSVNMLCESIADYIEQEDEKMQGVLPHYFEKYKTDGIEYNIYVGQAILEKGDFSSFFLKDFRLWQLLHLCEITRMVANKATEMPVPLTTAQLVFVYNSTLSIRFRMDEKQFDVDGAYNVRYEILKKRIDKAVVKGSGERLTQSGKIAIVWLQEKDKQEYLEYLHYLLQKGFITEDIEDLELEKLQGAEGLRALRVTVV